MRNKWPYCGALIALIAPAPLLAQGMAVHDNANLLQHIQTVRNAVQIVAQGKQQIAEAKKLYQDLNKLTDISSLARQLKSDALRALDVSDASLEGFGDGKLDAIGAARGRADKVYRDLMAKLGKAGSPATRAAFDEDARNIGLQAGLARAMGASATSRQEGLSELRDRLASAGTAKEVADLTARLTLESVAMQNDQLRMQAIAMEREARERERAAAGRADLAAKADAANRYHRGER